MKPLRFGILGTARIASRQVEAMALSKYCRPVAIASRSLDRAREFADTHGDIHDLQAIEGYDTLLESDDIDAVFIPLPNHLHVSWAIKALRAGKHVLVDKPLAIHSDDLKQLCQVAEETGLYVMEGFMYRFHPVFDKIVEIINQGTIGMVRHLGLEFCQNIAGYLGGEDNYRYYLDQGGGALFDLGGYGCDLFQYLLGNLTSIPVTFDLVYASQEFFDPGTIPSDSSEDPADETTHALFRATSTELDHPVTCGLTVSFGFHRKKFWIAGSDGSIEIDHIAGSGSKQIKLIQDSTDLEETIDIDAVNTYRLQYDAFARAISDQLPSPIPLDQSERTLAMIEAIFKKARQQ